MRVQGKIINLLGYLISAIVLFVFLQIYCKYDYLHAEQFRMFRYSWDYAAPLLSSLSGWLTYGADFLTQFYVKPVYASLIHTLIFGLIVLGSDRILCRFLPSCIVPAFSILLGLWMTILSTGVDYKLEHTLLLLVVLAVLNVLVTFIHPVKYTLKPFKNKILRVAIPFLLMIAAFHVGLQLFVRNHPAQSTRLKVLEVMRWNKDWDGILKLPYMNRMPNALYSSYQNLALAEKGKLDQFAQYPQLFTPLGLWYENHGLQHELMLLSDIYFVQGNVAMSQMMAFNAQAYGETTAQPHLMERLIETNLILGAYPVAEKYIGLLEETLYYKESAQHYRTFLNHPEAVEKDPVLGPLAQITQKLSGTTSSIDLDLEEILAVCPDYKPAQDYLNAFKLVNKK